MEWVLVSPQIHSTFASLGHLEGDVYHTNKECLSSLKEIYDKLNKEDRNLRTFRRTVSFGQSIQKDLIPILINVKDDHKILDLTIKILVNLTVPIECLLQVDETCKTNLGRHTIIELNSLLRTCKESFRDHKVTKSILDYINRIFDNNGKMSPTDADNVNNCLLLLRNILHIPDTKMTKQPPGQGSLQNQILWNLFTNSIDKTLLHLISSPQGSCWSVTIVQLIALIYKDQHIGTLQKLLNLWFEASLSESSDDNESNTSPPHQHSDDSSPLVSSDPTSDSSDNGCFSQSIDNLSRITKMDTTYQQFSELSKAHKSTQNKDAEKKANILPEQKMCSGPNTSSKRECTSANSEFSDCGYVTQIENRESISISSNEDDEAQNKPVHQKPHSQKQRHCNKMPRPMISTQERKEKRRKRLVKRGRTSIINMKGLLHHTPTDDDITNVLKEFTVDFLLKGYGLLVHSLHSQLIYNDHLQIDTSHFFWLLTYFMKFAAQLELDLEFVQHILTFDIISYLTYEGVNLCEQIQLISKFNNSDLKSCLRRIHLVITAIREFIQTIDIYQKITHLNDSDRVQLLKLQLRISSTEDLRCLFVLLLRHYQPDIHSKQYLQDLIVTNHILLTFLDNTLSRPECENTILVEHMQQFATVEVMHQYGLLLQDYQTNGEFVNDCIFTMMHHVSGDLKCVSTLYQPNILKVILTMWETGFELCNDWSDLISYVINSFMRNPRAPQKSDNDDDSKNDSALGDTDSWTDYEIDTLHWNYMQSIQSSNVIQRISSLYKEDGIEKSHNSIVKQLFRRNIIQYDEYRKLLCSISDTNKEMQIYFNSSNNTPVTKDEIEELKSELKRQNMNYALIWLQNVLLETCYSKICFSDENIKDNMDQIIPAMEPISYHNILMNQSVPIIPWNNEQSAAIHNQTFLILLHRLGLHLPIDSGKLFVRIPNFWTAEVLFCNTNRLGPINEPSLKFSIKQSIPRPEDKKPIKSSSFDLYHPEPMFVGPVYYKNGSLYQKPQDSKKIRSMVEVTEVTSVKIKKTKISTIRDNDSSWLNIIMKSKDKTKKSKSLYHEKSDRRKDMKVFIKKENVHCMPFFSKFGNTQSIPSFIKKELCDSEASSVTTDLNNMNVSDCDNKSDVDM